MRFALNTISKGLLFSFLVFAAAEIYKPGAAALFLPSAALFLLVLAVLIASIIFPEKERGDANPLFSAVLTLMILAGSMFLTWRNVKELGKIGFAITAGAGALAAAVSKIIFSKKE